MLSPEEFIHRWKWGERTQANPQQLEDVMISPEVKNFLVVAGLPTKTQGEEQLEFDFGKTESFATIAACLKDNPVSPSFGQMRKLGKRIAGSVCLDEQKNGALFLLYGSTNEIQFLNSSVIHLAESILVSAELVEMFHGGQREYEKYEDRQFACEWLKTQLERIDPAVLQDSQSLWSNVLFELYPGAPPENETAG